jgi:regulator of replication initiation timing
MGKFLDNDILTHKVDLIDKLARGIKELKCNIALFKHEYILLKDKNKRLKAENEKLKSALSFELNKDNKNTECNEENEFKLKSIDFEVTNFNLKLASKLDRYARNNGYKFDFDSVFNCERNLKTGFITITSSKNSLHNSCTKEVLEIINRYS